MYFRVNDQIVEGFDGGETITMQLPLWSIILIVLVLLIILGISISCLMNRGKK